MQVFPSIDLTRVHWIANNIDGSTIEYGPQKYETIDRNKLESFEFIYQGECLLRIGTKGKTIAVRLKTLQSQNLSSQEQKILGRVWIAASLVKNKDAKKNHTCRLWEDNKLVQQYSFDPEQSKIYYLYENGKVDIRNKFVDLYPYRALKLRPEELEHLNHTVE